MPAVAPGRTTLTAWPRRMSRRASRRCSRRPLRSLPGSRHGHGGSTSWRLGGDALIGDVDLDVVDIDLTTDARPEEILDIVRGWADAVWEQGRQFGTIGLRKGDRVFEITTHRAEVYREDSRKPSVTFGDDVETDLARRDFTINAMALDLPTLSWWTPSGVGGPRPAQARDPARPRGLLQRRPAAHASGGALHRPLRPRPRRRLVESAVARSPTGSPSCRPSGSATSSTRSCWSTSHPSRSGSSCARAWPTISARAAGPGAGAGPDPAPQGRARAHVRRRRQDVPGPAAAARGALPRHRQAPDAGLRRAGSASTITRSSGADDPGAHGGAALPDRRGRDRHEARRAAPALPHLPDGMDRPGRAPLRPRRRRPAGPAERADEV